MMGSMDKMRDLSARKKEIESEIAANLSVLESEGGVGMSEPLVDAEGFPRNDVDLLAIRTARQRVIRLRNDHKALMKEIETELECIHQRARETGFTSTTSATDLTGSKSRDQMETDDSNSSPHSSPPPPFLPPRHFARIAQVASGSPADAAGLRSNDLLLKFGSISCENFHKLQDVAAIVSHSKGVHVALVVARNANGTGSGEWKTEALTLTPQTWSGRGLLGCNIVPQSCAEARMN